VLHSRSIRVRRDECHARRSARARRQNASPSHCGPLAAGCRLRQARCRAASAGQGRVAAVRGHGCSADDCAG